LRSTSALVQSDVPPTAVTSGSDAGQPADGSALDRRAALPDRRLLVVGRPAVAGRGDDRHAAGVGRLEGVAQVQQRLLAAERASAVPKDCEMTSARWWSTTYFSTALNPQLDDRAPARLCRDGDLDEVSPAIIAAERAFLTGG
jgi:hypothetical protein